MTLLRLLLLTVEVAVRGVWLYAVEWQLAILKVWGVSIRARMDRDCGLEAYMITPQQSFDQETSARDRKLKETP